MKKMFLALIGIGLASCEVSPYECKEVTYLNGEVYSIYTWEANNWSECGCIEYDYQSGPYLFQTRCE